jgi:hypothetical protein
MITKVVLDSSGTEHDVEWSWKHESGNWWPEIETVDGEVPEFSAEVMSVVQDACADDYPLWQYHDDRAGDDL